MGRLPPHCPGRGVQGAGNSQQRGAAAEPAPQLSCRHTKPRGRWAEAKTVHGTAGARAGPGQVRQSGVRRGTWPSPANCCPAESVGSPKHATGQPCSSHPTKGRQSLSKAPFTRRGKPRHTQHSNHLRSLGVADTPPKADLATQVTVKVKQGQWRKECETGHRMRPLVHRTFSEAPLPVAFMSPAAPRQAGPQKGQHMDPRTPGQ